MRCFRSFMPLLLACYFTLSLRRISPPLFKLNFTLSMRQTRQRYRKIHFTLSRNPAASGWIHFVIVLHLGRSVARLAHLEELDSHCSAMPLTLRHSGGYNMEPSAELSDDGASESVASQPNSFGLVIDRKFLAEGPIECKSGRNTFKKGQWTERYCLLDSDALRIFKNETCQKEVIALDLYDINAFTSIYRVVRGQESGNHWGTSEGVFAFSDKYGQKLKLRVAGDEDVNYWTTIFSDVLKKAIPSQPRTRDPVERSAAGRFLLGPLAAGEEKVHSVPMSSSLTKAKNECLVDDDSMTNASPQSEHALRHQMASEFIDAVRRTDSMLQERQLALRSQLEVCRPTGVSTVLSTKIPAITDDEEAMSQASSSTLLSSDFLVRSPIRHVSVTARRNPNSMSCTESTLSAISPNTFPKTCSMALQTIVVDHCETEDHGRTGQVGRAVGTRSQSEVLYTSSLLIQLAPRCAAADSTAGRSGHYCCLAVDATPTSCSWTVPRNTHTHARSLSKCGESASPGSQRPITFSPTRLAERYHSDFKKSLERLAPKLRPPPTAPPPPPPPQPYQRLIPSVANKPSQSGDATPTSIRSLPSSFLAELRAAAMKRQLSMQCPTGGVNKE